MLSQRENNNSPITGLKDANFVMSLIEFKIIVLKKMSYEKTHKDNSMKFSKCWGKYLIEMNFYFKEIKIIIGTKESGAEGLNE